MGCLAEREISFFAEAEPRPSLPVEPATATKLVTEMIGFSRLSFAKNIQAGAATTRAW
jgi:hypothetical protein